MKPIHLAHGADPRASAAEARRRRYGERPPPPMTLAAWLRWLAEMHRLFPPPPARRRPFIERDMRL